MRKFLTPFLAGSFLTALFFAPAWGDGIQMNLGTGGSILDSDTIGGQETQVFKPAWGVDGTADYVDATNPLPVQGGTAHDSAVGDVPVQLGGEARTTLPTAVADGDVVRLQADDLGRLIVTPYSPRDLVVQNQHIENSTTEDCTLLAAGAAGVFHDVVFLSMSNESATEVRVDILDSSGGNIRVSMDLAPDGGGAVLPFPVPMQQGTAALPWCIDLSVSVSNVYVTIIAIKSN